MSCVFPVLRSCRYRPNPGPPIALHTTVSRPAVGVRMRPPGTSENVFQPAWVTISVLVGSGVIKADSAGVSVGDSGTVGESCAVASDSAGVEMLKSAVGTVYLIGVGPVGPQATNNIKRTANHDITHHRCTVHVAYCILRIASSSVPFVIQYAIPSTQYTMHSTISQTSRGGLPCAMRDKDTHCQASYPAT